MKPARTPNINRPQAASTDDQRNDPDIACRRRALQWRVFCIYWWDKRAAGTGDWRVRETTLLALAFLGGGIGALLAQRLLRHKTRKSPFPVALPAFFTLQMIVLSVALVVRESGAAAEALHRLLGRS